MICILLEINQAISLGAKFGLKAITTFSDLSVETPEMGSEVMEGAMGIIDLDKYQLFSRAELPSLPSTLYQNRQHTLDPGGLFQGDEYYRLVRAADPNLIWL